MPIQPATITEKFLARVEQRGPNQCWWWTGAVDRETSFPKMRLPGNRMMSSVARFAWEIAYMRGPIPAGYVITRGEHEWDPCPDPSICVHRMCMNPAHLRLTRKAELDATRMRARSSMSKTHCRRDHPLTDGNVVWLSRAKNKRMCRICYEDLRARHALAQH